MDEIGQVVIRKWIVTPGRKTGRMVTLMSLYNVNRGEAKQLVADWKEANADVVNVEAVWKMEIVDCFY